MKFNHIILLFNLFICTLNLSAQLSPGDLSNPHAGLEGVSNCTKCHAVGNKVTREKCLNCHKEIKASIQSKHGYHASSEVGNKECAVCHNEHHGRNFKLIRFNKKTFVHAKSGFALKGAHAKQQCNACHKPAFIKDNKFKQKKDSYFGLNQACLSCHEDYHKGGMSSNCTQCHSFDSFKNATGFNHNSTKFPLLGQHKNVSCDQCHKTELTNGKPLKKYKGLKFANCNACHNDVHENKFGQDCKKCHTEQSFKNVKTLSGFNHDITGFKLIGKHNDVACKSCHKTSLTAPIKHNNCSDCHTDYHNKEFAKNNVSPECNQCHTNNGFTPSTFTIENHAHAKMPLEGAHLATPCFSCHLKSENNKQRWTFRNIGSKCIDCHTNVHKDLMDAKFIPTDDCTACHTTTNWKKVSFDHSKTNFKLEGEHAKQLCSACHYKKNQNGVSVQQFRGMNMECSSCHNDPHVGQFAINGKTDCSKCHGFNRWEDSTFDHTNSRFKLKGAHATVKCEECHKKVNNSKGEYIEYKFDNIECSKCHS